MLELKELSDINMAELAQKKLHRLYSAKKLPESEIAAIQRWIADPANEQYTKEPMQEIFERYINRYRWEEPPAGAWDEFIAANGLQKLEEARREAARKKAVRLRRKRAIWVAAGLMPLLIIGGAISLLIGKPEADVANRPTVIAEAVVVTADSTRTEVLPDGSKVILNEGAELEYMTDFARERKVRLRGDAFFSVAKMEGKTFEVLYNDMTVRVLGTEFFLHELNGKSEVTLQSGSVEIETAQNTVRLEPNQRLIADFADNEFTVHEMTGGEMARMARGKLKIHNMPLDEALRMIGDYYDMEMEFVSFAHKEMVRLELNWDDEPEDALYLLRGVSRNAFDYDITKDKITISGR